MGVSACFGSPLLSTRGPGVRAPGHWTLTVRGRAAERAGADVLLGLGLGFTVKIATEGSAVQLEPTDQMYAAFGGLFLSLLFSVLYVTQTLHWVGLRLRALVGRPGAEPAAWTFTGGALYGVVLIVFYLCYLTVNITLEFV